LADSKRITRPDLDRIAPIRDFSRIFGPPGSEEPPRSNGTNGAAPPRADDGVARGVRVGYQVIEDYMRQGEEFARAMYGAGSSGSIGGVAAPFFAPRGDGGELQATAGRLLQVAADFAAAWMDLMQATSSRRTDAPVGGRRPEVPGFDIDRTSSAPAAAAARPEPGPPPPSTPAAGGESAAGAWTAPAPAPVTLRIHSKQQVEVALDIRPGPMAGPLVAHDLRAIDPALPRIGGVSVDGAEGGERLIVRVHVPDDHPPAVYSGIIVDERTNLPRGTISVRVLAPETGAAPPP
jgi:hypothetical protein